MMKKFLNFLSKFFSAITLRLGRSKEESDTETNSIPLSFGSFSFSNKSLQNINTCDKKLQRLFFAVLSNVDCSIISGYRNEKEQNELFLNKRTQLKWPDSNHNCYPSKAIDVVPYPVLWDDEERFYKFANLVFKEAENLGILVKWGGDWKNFPDVAHWELM
mgnify:CR=1 FL=1|jgi:peptidoglycan LD-endopeptidase CwlK